MSNTINVKVRNKIATAPLDVSYICGNSDFVIVFDFDEEWDAVSEKTARFVYNGKYQDVVFTGNQCPVPIISNTYRVHVGVFAGNLQTTTSAYIPSIKSILCGSGTPDAPSENIMKEILAALKGINTKLGDLETRIEALEQGSGGTDPTTTAILDYSRLDEMILQ